MKLRYYLRGLGIGMIVTALIMGIALKGDRSLSDAEIRVRAMELGMVDGDSRTLANVQASPEPVHTSEPVLTPKPVPTQEPESIPESGSTSEPASTNASMPDSSELTSSKPLPMTTLKPPGQEPGSSDQAVTEPDNPESVTFEVFLGQNSYSVSKALVEAGLVEDADEFDKYLVDNGYSKRIRPGTYEIPLNSSQEEIAEIITRS